MAKAGFPLAEELYWPIGLIFVARRVCVCGAAPTPSSPLVDAAIMRLRRGPH